VTDVIAIRAWDKFQHYKDRDPPWIKVYRDLLTAESWVLGTDDSRLVQIASMLLAARYRNATPLNYSLFRKVASLDLTEARFNAAIRHLSQSGFLDIQELETDRNRRASSVLAACTSETETETETEEMGRARKRATPARRCPDGWEPPEAEVQKMRAECPDIDLLAATRKFRDHEFARGRSDWLATWRNWMREEQSRAATRPRPIGQAPKRAPPTEDEIVAERRKAAEANRRELAAKVGAIAAMPR